MKNLFGFVLACIFFQLHATNLQDELQIEFRWPQGIEIQDIGKHLDIYRDFRSYKQLLLIHNESENALLLQDVNVHGSNHEIIPIWLVPAKNIAVLLVQQESIALMCIEKFEFGERKSSCQGLIKAGLLPETMIAKINKAWVGNFSTINELDVSFRSIGIHLVL